MRDWIVRELRDGTITVATLASCLDRLAASAPAGATARLADEVVAATPGGDLTDRVAAVIRDHPRIERAFRALHPAPAE